MAGKERGVTWHNTTVVLQADIYRQALGQGIDISDACNRALAGLTGIDYCRQPHEAGSATPPVIVARNGSFPQGGVKKNTAQKLHPVINADDPAAPATVIRTKVQPVKKSPAEPPDPVSAPQPATRKENQAPAATAATKRAAVAKDRGIVPKKRSKGDALKAFFSSKFLRTDDPDDTLGKDLLFDLFSRFCRQYGITPVPERKSVTIALKNQFALAERQVNGIPSWIGIRLK
ncbi:MAG TPA: hypothetical protein P5013_01440 [Methanoregula sp.]|nr:hypothetical protein [Methanoregula sp.]